MSSETLNTAGALGQANDLKSRIFFTVFILIIYRLGTYVPLSGVDPLALKEIAKASVAGQKQHNPDKPLSWDRSKSGDELDAMVRHLLDHASGELVDDDGIKHIVKCGWRILAYIQKTIEDESK